jgi:Flp pilus assembly secretin CpaC
MRHILLPAVLLGNILAAVSPAAARDLTVTLDEVRTITFATPVSTVYVGNPSIADINMIDARHAFIQGKGYGSTNIVALGHDGAQVSNTRVNVLSNDGQSTVVLNRGAARITYSCTSTHCEATPQPGDDKDAFATGNTEIGQHEDAAKKAAMAQ